MAEFEALLQRYELEASLATDSGSDCVTIDVGLHVDLISLSQYINDILLQATPQVQSATKLYVFGKLVSRNDFNTAIQWSRGVARVCQLIEAMTNLKELTWVSELPFLEMIWEFLPKSLTKLIIDIGRPTNLDPDDSHRESFISQDGMRPLVNFNKLWELRIFGMQDSFQSIIWETVFRNEADNNSMQVLDLQMAEAPLVRQDNWVRGNHVTGLHVSNKDPEVSRGVDGKGILHHNYGTGEYLDDHCMRKARLASGLDETRPLPLWCLKLDGFVVDSAPFEHELSHLVLLTCGENCIDAGLRAPRTSWAKTRNKWGPRIKNEATHCLIMWPNWRAIFDNEGRLLDPSGQAVTETNSGESLPPDTSPETASTSTEQLNLKDLTEALGNIRTSDPKSCLSENSNTSLKIDTESIIPIRGSSVPSQRLESLTTSDTQDSNPYTLPAETDRPNSNAGIDAVKGKKPK